MWEKRTLWENAARVPLVLRAPWLTPPEQLTLDAGAGTGAGKARRSSAPVELVDIFATVCDVLGVPLPTGEEHPIEGTSLKPLLLDPIAGDLRSGVEQLWTKEAALTMYPRCPTPSKPDWEGNSCIHATERQDFAYMGYSMLHRNASNGAVYRYTEWLPWNGSALAPAHDILTMSQKGSKQRVFRPKAVELYNHTDILPRGISVFDAFENVNLAAKGGSTPPALLAALSSKLHALFAL